MSTELAEVELIAGELARAYGRMVEHYRTTEQLPAAEAHARAITPRPSVLAQPSEQVSWTGMSSLVEHSPEQAYALWQRIKQDALAELETGYRVARVMETSESRPWKRAQFLAIRQSFLDEWQPTGGIERTLIDVLATAHASYLNWLDILTSRSEHEAMRERRQLEENDPWSPPRVTDQAAIDNAAAMVDRFNRLFLRTLRQLRDLRRYAPALVINNPGQVNIGQQQVNTAGGVPALERT